MQRPGESANGVVRGDVEWREASVSPDGPLPAQPVIAMVLELGGAGWARFDQATLRGDTLQGVLTFLTDSTPSYGMMLIREGTP